MQFNKALRTARAVGVSFEHVSLCGALAFILLTCAKVESTAHAQPNNTERSTVITGKTNL